MKHAPDTDLTPHFNRLAPDVAERLEILGEEAAEILQVLAKIKRHGLDSHHPKDAAQTNRALLEKEIGHFELMLVELINHRDIDPVHVNESCREKRATINQWLHHNEVKA